MILCLVLAFTSVTQTVIMAEPVRMCVPSSRGLAAPCAQMAEDLPETFTCVVAPDPFSCLEKISSGEADITNVNHIALYLAGKFFNLKPIVTELVDGKPYRYQAIALVAKEDPSIQSANDLKGKRSCHTGFWRSAGWQIPVGKLLAENIMQPSCEEGELAAVSNFFSGSCVAGNWTFDPVVDKILKDRYPSLCSQCNDPASCSEDDLYYGAEGAIRCLVDGQGDVGFTNLPVLKEYLAKYPELAEQAELLCFDGGRKSVNDEEPCVWGDRLTNAYVARANNDEETEKLVTALLNTQTRYSVPYVRKPQWYYKTFLSYTKITGLRRTVAERRTYTGYLGESIDTIRKPRPGCPDDEQYDASFCTTSDPEEFKCQDYSKAAYARGLWPNIRCIRTASKAACMEALKNGNVDIVDLDGGDIYKAGRYYDLEPLAAETYDGSDASYHAVAVQRSVSDVTKLSELRGVRSCHTGIGRTAGWVIPVGVLSSEGLLTTEEGVCNYANAVADFFSGGSCVPGANDTKYNPGRVRSDDLCRQCIGDEEGQNRCARDSAERYSGYGGAFRCLAEGKGDVAFVRDSTVSEYTDGQGEAHWARNLVSSDFQLLCSEGTAPISDYLSCNLGTAPSHYIMIGPGIEPGRRNLLSEIIALTARYLGQDTYLYNSFHKGVISDLLFKDTKTSLKVVPPGTTYEEVLGSRFVEASRAVDPKACD